MKPYTWRKTAVNLLTILLCIGFTSCAAETPAEVPAIDRSLTPAQETVNMEEEIHPEVLPVLTETEPETEVSETMAPETEAPETKAPETKAPEIAVPVVTIPEGTTFVCNTNTGKYHLPSCSSVEKIQSQNISYLSCTEDKIPTNYEPCSICLKDSTSPNRAPQSSATDDTEFNYVLNTNTKKFHSPACKSVANIKAENYATFTGTRDDAIAAGYDPCGNCKP